MRRAARHLFAFCAAIALLACVAALGLWARGYAATDIFGVAVGRNHVAGVASEQGSILFVWTDETLDRLFVWTTRPPGFTKSFLGVQTLAGFGYRRAPGATVIFVPNWLVIASACVAAVALIRQARKRRLTAPGLCPTCGYDLRASPDRCPERAAH